MTITNKWDFDGTWKASFITSARPEQVYDYLIDFQRHTEWEDDLSSVSGLGEKLSVGRSFSKIFGTKPPGLKGLFFSAEHVECTVTAAERPILITWQEKRKDAENGGDYTNEIRFELRDHPAGSEVLSEREFFRLPHLFNTLMDRFMNEKKRIKFKAVMEKVQTRDKTTAKLIGPDLRSLEALKRILDQSADQPR